MIRISPFATIIGGIVETGVLVPPCAVSVNVMAPVDVSAVLFKCGYSNEPPPKVRGIRAGIIDLHTTAARSHLYGYRTGGNLAVISVFDSAPPAEPS